MFNNKKKIIKNILKIFSFSFLLIVVFFAGLYLPGKNETIKELAKNEAISAGKVLGIYSQPQKGLLTQDIDFSLFWDVWRSLRQNYVDRSQINEKEMFYGAIRGMVESVKDPYTVFMDPRISTEFTNDLAGTFDGIGAEIGLRNGILTIVSPLIGSPSEKVGLKAGDKILEINGTSTQGILIEEAVFMIRGPKGTKVKLLIMRQGFNAPKEFEIIRDKIVVKSVKTEKRDNIFVVKISNFNDDTKTLFLEAVHEIIKTNPKGVVLDLRNNPGGYLETAIDVASEWIEKGVIVVEKFSEDKKNEFLNRGRARLKDIKTVVLVNEGSASASEIVAGALKDYNKAILVGKKTFGKGSVQTLEKFNDGSSLKITVAEWLTPKGTCINKEGIIPDIEVELKIEDLDAGKDLQMEKALEILKN